MNIIFKIGLAVVAVTVDVDVVLHHTGPCPGADHVQKVLQDGVVVVVVQDQDLALDQNKNVIRI